MEKFFFAKILVIDDDEIIVMTVEQVLKKNGYASISANNGVTGLQAALAEQPDLIILDRRMPEVDGNKTLIWLKADDKTKDIPVIMLTGDTRVSDISTSLELGAIDYIVKPFDTPNFLIRIQKALQKQDRHNYK